MGWGRFLLLGDLGQQLDLSDQRAEIEQLRNELSQRRSASSESPDQIKMLQNENDELRLYLAALVRILVSKGIITPEQLKQVVETIDTEDGSSDGKHSGKII